VSSSGARSTLRRRRRRIGARGLVAAWHGLEGHCVVERGARIGPNAILNDVFVGESAQVATIEATNARIGAEARVESFVVLAPGAVIASGEVVTPFSYRTP